MLSIFDINSNIDNIRFLCSAIQPTAEYFWLYISRSFTRYVLHAGKLDASDNLVDTDISAESTEVQGICNSVWTTAVKDAYKALLIENKPL